MILVLFIIAIGAACPWIIRNVQAARQQLRLAAQFRASLQNMVHGLRIGISFHQALAYAAKESAEPMRQEWERAQQTLRLGTPLPEALNAFVQRIGLKEAETFSIAVQLTQSSGGSLADVLDTLSATLQERETLREKVAALTAQGRASGFLLALLPYALLGAMSMVEPDMAGYFFHTAMGQTLLVGITLSIATGGVFIKKIVTVPVN